MKGFGVEPESPIRTIFDWNDRKARANKRKHGVTFEEAASAFSDPGAQLLADPDHSDEEDRFVLVGRSALSRLLVVVHVERGQGLRIISAWKASSEDRKHYEESSKAGR